MNEEIERLKWYYDFHMNEHASAFRRQFVYRQMKKLKLAIQAQQFGAYSFQAAQTFREDIERLTARQR